MAGAVKPMESSKAMLKHDNGTYTEPTLPNVTSTS